MNADLDRYASAKPLRARVPINAMHDPAAQNSADDAVSEVHLCPPNPKRPGSYTDIERVVMVVDDDSAVREALSDILGVLGYGVVMAADGRDAMALLAAGHKPFVILLDLAMPVMNGWEFKNLIRSRVEYEEIPIIVITAIDEKNTEVSETTAILAKPISMQRLVNALKICEASA